MVLYRTKCSKSDAVMKIVELLYMDIGSSDNC